jgi:hypothetical protein
LTPAPSRSRRLSRREFARALRLGLGRARIDVRSFGLEGRLDLLVAACLRDPTLDHQLEGGLAGWLLAIARDGGGTAEVRRAVIASSSRRIRPRDRGQIASILGHLALDGDRAARRALLRMVDVQPPTYRVATCAIWALGEDGWLRVIRSYGRRWGEATHAFESGWIVRQARDELGARRTVALVRVESATRRGLGPLARCVEAQSRRRSRSLREEGRPPATLAELERRVAMRTRRGSDWKLRRWAKDASAADRAEAWRRLVAETDSRRILRRLWAWCRRKPPALHPRLFELARHERQLVRVNAIGILAQVRDPRVRSFALRLLRDDPADALDVDVLDLLERNARDADTRIVGAAPRPRTTVRARHNWASGVLKIAEVRRSAVWTPLLVRALEISPCRMCREFILEHLVERGAATDAMLSEALFDANDDVREVAREASKRFTPARARGGSRGRPSRASAGP